MDIASVAFTLFLIMNSLGLVPLILTLLQGRTVVRQRLIILREMSIALVLILFFNFLGEIFFDWLKINFFSIQMAGGLILFLIAIRMIFPGNKKREESSEEEPFIVPIATPLVAGPSLLATVMMLAKQESSSLTMVLAILLAWMASTLIFLAAPLLKRIFGDKGLTAFQRLMGLLLTLVAIQMFLQGLSQFVTLTFYAGGT